MEPGMRVRVQPTIESVDVSDERIIFTLSDERHVSIPIGRSARLAGASPDERASWRIGGFGTHVEWPLIDEHVGIWTILGIPEDVALRQAGFETPR